jgi:hypothetical protein
MFVNPYSVLAAFVAVLEGLLGLVLLVLVLRASGRRAVSVAGPERSSDVVPMLGWAALVLVALALVSWPLLYLLLQSQVPLWPGVMCIQGVLDVGRDAAGSAAWLPALAATLQVTKPALVFLAGLWLVLHLVDRATRTGPLRPALLGALGLLAAVAVVDAATQTAYLTIPKEHAPDSGCCTLDAVARHEPLRWPLLASLGPAATHTTLLVAHFALGVLLVLATSAWSSRAESGGPYRPPRFAPALLVLAALAVPVGVAFLARVAAPALLARPEHRCAYCVLVEAPETVVGVGLFLLGAFAVGWAVLLPLLARGPEARAALGRPVRTLVSLARFSYAGATVFAAVALGIA